MNQKIKPDPTFKKKLLKQVVKEAKQYKKRYHYAPDKESIGNFKIQTANPFIRLISGAFGLFIIWAGYCLIPGESTFINAVGIVLILIGGIFVVLGIRGRKRELNCVLETIDVVDGFEIVLEAIADFIDI